MYFRCSTVIYVHGSCSFITSSIPTKVRTTKEYHFMPWILESVTFNIGQFESIAHLHLINFMGKLSDRYLHFPANKMAALRQTQAKPQGA